MNIAQQLHQQLGVEDALFRKQVHGGNWDELSNIMEPRMRDQIAEAADMTAMMEAAVREAGTGTAEFYTMCTGTMRQLQNFSDTFASLVLRRNGRTGQTQNSEEYTDYMSVGLEHVSLNDEMRIVISNALFMMTEHHNHALEVLRERAASVNPDIITDVTDKDELQEAPVIH